MTEQISQQEFDDARKKAIENEPLAKKIKISDIELVENSYKDNVIKLAGKPVAVGRSFFNQLGEVLNISRGMTRDLTLGDKSGNELLPKMIEAMKTVKANIGNGQEITVIGNPTTNTIVGITEKPYTRIPNGDLFNIADSIANRHSGVSISGVKVTDGGDVHIKFLNGDNHPFKPVGGPDGGDETFKFGFGLSNGMSITKRGGPSGNGGMITSIEDYMMRQVCSNGAIGFSAASAFKLKGLDQGSIKKMFEHIHEMEKNNFVPFKFQEMMDIAGHTNASYSEVEKAFKLVMDCIPKYDNDALRQHAKMELAKSYFPGLVHANIKLATKGIDPMRLSDEEKKFVKTNQSVWDLINSITWLGSHEAYGISDPHVLQVAGAKMMAKQPDFSNLHLLEL